MLEGDRKEERGACGSGIYGSPKEITPEKMAKRELPPNEALYPVPVVLVTIPDKKRKSANIITIAWCGVVCSKPPTLSISIRPSRYSHELISQAGDFVINIPSKNMMKATDLCGIRSGRETDKFKLASFTSVPASKVQAPLIKECPVNIECSLKDTIRLGSHDMFLGEVVAVHVDEEIVDPAGRIDYGRAGPFVYNLGEYWDLGKKIGFYGCSSK